MPTYNTALGVLPSANTQLFGGNAGQGTQGELAPGARAPRQAQAQQVQQPPQTFAQLQQQGQARPAPQQFQLGQTFQGGAQTSGMLSQLQQRLNTMDQQSVYDNPAFQQRRQAAIGNLQAERQASESALNEEMARRGLAASSIASGRMGDIAGQFARAQATMEADLLKEAMAQEQQRQQFVTQQMGSLYGTVSGQELQGFQANIESAKAQADIQQRAEQMQQEERLKGRELDLAQARDMATAEYQRGQLAQAAAEMASREKMQQQQFQFQAGESQLERAQRQALQTEQIAATAQQSQLERALREKMQFTELSAAEKRQLVEIEANKASQAAQFAFTGAQSQLERDLRQKMQTTELTAAEKRQLLEIEANKAQQERQFGFQRGESELERNLREKMQTTELTAAEKRQLTDIEAQKARQAQSETFQAGQSTLERNLREKMQTTELTAAEKRQLMDIEATKQRQQEQFGFQRGESELERANRLAMQKTDIEAQKARQTQAETFQMQQNQLDRNLREVAQMSETTGVQHTVDANGRVVPKLDANGRPIPTSAVSQAQEERSARLALQESQQKFSAGESALDRQLRERLGMTEATGIMYGADGKPILDASGKPVQTLAGRQFTQQQQQAQNNFLMQLASVLAPMKQSDRDAFIRNLPPELRTLFGASASASGLGGGGVWAPGSGNVNEQGVPQP